MRSKVFIFLLLLLLLPFPESWAQKSFDDVLKQALEDKKAQFELYKGEFKRRDQSFDKMWQERKAEIEKKWDEALRSTKKEWVDYRQDLNARSYVNFDKGFVEVTAVVPMADKSVHQTGELLINERMLKLFSKDNPSNTDILADQVPLSPNRTVTPKIAQRFFQQKKKDIVVMKRPFTGKDGIPRVKVKLRFNLLPNHLQVRARRFHGLVNGYANRYSLRPELIFAVIHTESYFNPLAVSPANAHGLMQLIPKYGARDAYRFVYGKDRVVSAAYLYIPKNNVELGTAYLNILRDNGFREVVDAVKRRYLVICAYNWGPGSISRKILSHYNLKPMSQGAVFHLLQKKTPEETANYLAKVTERMKLYAKLYR